jgi:HAD superfamily hydrolase (TIGR01484 family)
MRTRYLASDLDGTLIPPALDAERRGEIAVFASAAGRRALRLVYITGRHLPLALEGIRAAGLPWPDRIFCDVGTSLYGRERGTYVLDMPFRHTMTEALGMAAMPRIRGLLSAVAGLELQEEAKQAEFKLSYYLRGPDRSDTAQEVRDRLLPLDTRVAIISSEDPVTGAGLMDILPHAAGKRQALGWLCHSLGLEPADVLCAGDSGNDRDALTSGHPAVLVGNAPDSLRAELAEEVRTTGVEGRLYFARAPFAAGVIEGCRHFGFL